MYKDNFFSREQAPVPQPSYLLNSPFRAFEKFLDPLWIS